MSDVNGEGGGGMKSHDWWGSLYSKVQCIMGNGHLGPSVDRQARMTLPYRNLTDQQALNIQLTTQIPIL